MGSIQWVVWCSVRGRNATLHTLVQYGGMTQFKHNSQYELWAHGSIKIMVFCYVVLCSTVARKGWMWQVPFKCLYLSIPNYRPTFHKTIILRSIHRSQDCNIRNGGIGWNLCYDSTSLRNTNNQRSFHNCIKQKLDNLMK